MQFKTVNIRYKAVLFVPVVVFSGKQEPFRRERKILNIFWG